MRCLRPLLFLSLLVCGAGFGIPSASAANRYWVGPQGGEWTNAAHWSTAANACGVNGGASVPGSADVALFVSNCVNDVSINPATVISGINIAAGYTGTGTLAGPLTITTFTQAGGSFVLNGHSLTINGAVTISGGTFSAGTATVILGGAAATINVLETLSLHHLTINANPSATKTIAASDVLIVNGTLTLQDGLLSQATVSASGTLLAHGNIVQESTFDGGTAQLSIVGAGNQLFTGNATRITGLLPRIRIDKPSGLLTLAGTIRVTSATTTAWVYVQGDIDASSQESTVIFAANGSLTITGSHALHHVIFDTNSATNRTHTLASGTVLTVLGDLTISNSSTGIITINTGAMHAKGDVFTPDTTNHTGSATIHINGTGAQILSGGATETAGGLPRIRIAKSSGILTLSGTIRTLQHWTYSQGDLSPGTSTVVFGGAAQTIEGSHSLNNVSFNGADARFTVADGTILTVKGVLTLDDGSINTGTVIAEGEVIHSMEFDGGTGILKFSGSSERILTMTGGSRWPALNIASAHTTIVGSQSDVMHVGGDFIQEEGSFQGAQGTLSIQGNFSLSGGMFRAPYGLMEIDGGFSQTGGIFDANGGTISINTPTQLSVPPETKFSSLILNTDLIGHWKFDEMEGSIALDSSIHKYHATHGNQPVYSTSIAPLLFPNESSLYFDGVNQYVMTDTKFPISDNQPRTISVWLKKEKAGYFSSQPIVTLGTVDTGRTFELIIHPSSLTIEAHFSGAGFYFVSPKPLSFNTWHHVLLSFDGAYARLYIDGILMNGGAYAINTKMTQLTIGGAVEGTWHSPKFFDGFLDDVRVYNRDLSADEVAHLAAGEENSSIFFLVAPLTLAGTLTLNGVTLDKNGKSLTYGTLASNGGVIIDSYVPPDNPSVPAVHPIPHGGGRGSLSPGRGGDAPAIDPATRRVLPQQGDTVSPLYRAPQSLPPPPAGVVSPVRERLAARIEKRIAEYPRLKTMLLKVLERMDRRLRLRAGR